MLLDTAVSLYARGFAHADLGDLKAAEADRAQLDAIVTTGDFAPYEFVGIPAKPMARLSLALLDGEIARRAGHLDGAIDQFEKARDIEITLPYTEPPYWHQPVSYLLGEALLAAHKPAEAEGVYRDSLQRYRLDGSR